MTGASNFRAPRDPSKATPIMPKDDRARGSRLQFILTVYRTDGLFRALVDVALVGAVILAFAANVPSSRSPDKTSRVDSLIAAAPSPRQDVSTQQTVSAGGRGPVGSIVRSALITLPHMDNLSPALSQHHTDTLGSLEKVLQCSGPFTSITAEPMLRRVSDDLPPGPLQDWARAVVLLNTRGFENSLRAQRFLRSAAEKGFPPAFRLMGIVELQTADMVENNLLPKSALQTMDTSGIAHRLSLEEMKKEALLWFERGASLGDDWSMAALGMAQATGLYGKPNLQAGLAHLRDAASHGNPAAKTELGGLMMAGHLGGDRNEAERLLREASSAGFLTAEPFLAMTLAGKPGAEEDLDIARQIEAAALKATSKDALADAQILGHVTLGLFYMTGAPLQMRNVERAVAHMKAAFELGHDPSAINMARAYRLGMGVPYDITTARAYVRIAEASGLASAAKAEKEAISREISPEQERVSERRAFEIERARKEMPPPAKKGCSPEAETRPSLLPSRLQWPAINLNSL